MNFKKILSCILCFFVTISASLPPAKAVDAATVLIVTGLLQGVPQGLAFIFDKGGKIHAVVSHNDEVKKYIADKTTYDGHEAITLAVCLATADLAVVGTATLIFASVSALSIMQPKIKEVVDKAIDWAVKSFITTGSAILARFKELGEHLANMIGNLAKDYNIYLAKQKVPSKVKDGDKVKTPDSHPDEFQKNKDGSYTHKPTGWKIKDDHSRHGGKHWDLSPPSGRGHLNVGPAGNIFGGRL